MRYTNCSRWNVSRLRAHHTGDAGQAIASSTQPIDAYNHARVPMVSMSVRGSAPVHRTCTSPGVPPDMGTVGYGRSRGYAWACVYRAMHPKHA